MIRRVGLFNKNAKRRQQLSRYFIKNSKMSLADNSKVNIQFVLSNKVVSACGNIGCTILELAQASGINMEGICGGSCSCTTCHVLFEKNMYKQLGEPSDEEVDMLELSTYIGNRYVRDQSRLGCQVKLDAVMEGAKITVPEAASRDI